MLQLRVFSKPNTRPTRSRPSDLSSHQSPPERSEGSAFHRSLSLPPNYPRHAKAYPRTASAAFFLPVTTHDPPDTNFFKIRIFEKRARNPFRMRSFKTKDLKPCRMCSSEKNRRGGLSPLPCLSARRLSGPSHGACVIHREEKGRLSAPGCQAGACLTVLHTLTVSFTRFQDRPRGQMHGEVFPGLAKSRVKLVLRFPRGCFRSVRSLSVTLPRF